MQKKYTLALQETSEFETIVFSGYPDMKFGLVNGNLCFNATKLYESVNARGDGDKKINPAQLAIDFTKQLGSVVDSMVEMYGMQADKVFYYNQDKDLIIDAVLDTAFLGFVLPAILTEAMDACRDILINNFAISDAMLISMANRKLPDEAIDEILKVRNK